MKNSIIPTLALAVRALAQPDTAQLEGPQGGFLWFSPAVPATDQAQFPEPVWFQGRGANRVALVRLAARGAAGYRLQFDEFRVPEDARLFLYGLGSSGAVTSAFGPYEGTGPSQEGVFRSRIIAGAVAVIEVQSRAPIAWPFRLGGVTPIAESELARMRERHDPGLTETEDQRSTATGAIHPCVVRGQEHWCEQIRGKLLFEGDIEIPESSLGEKPGKRGAIGISGAEYSWSGGRMPYVINVNLYPDPESGNPDSRLIEAIRRFNAKLPGMLIPWTAENDYLEFTWTNEDTCHSPVGHQGDRQYVYITDTCTTGSIIHEIGHAAGLWHEQSREDRDNHLIILSGNIEPLKEHNFDKHIKDGDDIGFYDFGSIMHYGRTAFGIKGRQTIETIPTGIPIGQRTALSEGDVKGIQRIQCSHAVDPQLLRVPFVGGDFQVNVTTPPYCDWGASSSTVWVEPTAGARGAGNGTVTLTVQRNGTLRGREGTAVIANRTVTILQDAAPR